MSAAASPPPARWLGIQYLRGLAACGVVAFHYFDGPMAPAGYDFMAGSYGVDLFFVISGFIMFAVARTEPVGRFLERRLSRIYPLYWIATAVAVAGYWGFDRIHPSGTELVQSLALWPHFSEAHRTQIWPVLVPGWSLSYELYFYALFAAGLAMRRPVLVPVLAIALAICLGALLHPQSAPLRVATNPVLAEFAAGLVVAAAALAARGWLALFTAWLGLLAGALLATGAPREAIGVAAAILVAATVLTERGGRLPDLALPRVLGDASYSIYLFHSPILLVIERTTRPANSPGLAATGSAALAIGGTVALCVVLHFVLEKPLLRTTYRTTRWLGQRLTGWSRDPADFPPGANPG